MIQKQNRYGQQSLTPVTRMIFGDVYTTTQVKGQGAYKFRITAVLNPTGELFQNLQAQVDRLMRLNFADEIANGDKLENPLLPCSKLKAFKDRPEYNGLYVIKASANPEYPPTIVDKNGLKNSEPGLIYPGCYIRMSVNPFAFDTMSKGVSFGLQGVSFVKDGRRIGAGMDPQEQFASVQPSQEELSWSVSDDSDTDDVPF